MTDLKFPRIKEKIIRKNEILQIRTDEIRPNRAQPRSNFDQNALIRLTDSIRRYGIMQPLTIRRLPPDDPDTYELIAGERRLRAAKLLGLFTVPCVILEVDERISAEMAIIENLLREDLNMFEQAGGFRRLIEHHSLTQEEVARKMSMSQSAVANKLRLLRLSVDEQEMILDGGLSERHARALLKLEDPNLRVAVIRYITENHLTVQATELYIEKVLQSIREGETKAKAIPQQTLRQEERTKELLASIRKKVQSMKTEGIRADLTVCEHSDGISVTICIAQADIVSRETT